MGHFIAAVLGRLVADECKAWLPWITRHMTKLAVRKLPKEQQERYEEEWASYLDEVPGELAKLWVACGFLRAARKASAEPLARKASAEPLAGFLRLAAAGIFFLAFGRRMR